MERGWFRWPAIHGGRVAFVADDDVWVVPAEGGQARRLTTGLGVCSAPRFTPDGARIVFTATPEGAPDLWWMDAEGGPPERLTWLAADATAQGFDPAGRLVLSSSHGRPFPRDVRLWAREGDGRLDLLPWGRASQLAWHRDGRVLLGRHTDDLARWQRYRGGRMGRLWVGPDGWRELEVGGNVATPLWIGDTPAAVSDRSGIAALWSLGAEPAELARHDWPVRFASGDGERVVYVAGGDLYRWDGAAHRIDVRLGAPAAQRARRFPQAAKYVESVRLHPEGHSVALTVRGQVFAGGLFEGPLRRIQQPGVRHRMATWLPDGSGLLTVADADGEPAFHVHPAGGEPRRVDLGDVGRPVDLAFDPTGARVAYTNHRGELAVFRLDGSEHERLFAGRKGTISGMAWSPDGRWLAWAEPMDGWTGSAIRLWSTETGATTAVTDGRWRDVSPSFDPEGGWLYLLSWREYHPIRQGLRFEYDFPYGCRPYAVALRADLREPFVPSPRPFKPKPRDPKRADKVEIELDGIEERILPLPVPEGRYVQLEAALGGRVVLCREPVAADAAGWADGGPGRADHAILVYEIEKNELVTLFPRAGSGFAIDAAGTAVAWREGWRLRIAPLRADKAQREEIGRVDPATRAGRRTWYFDPARIRLEVDPAAEWRQMVGEAWRLVRDHTWEGALAGVDLPALRDRYLGAVERVRTRSELSDLLWCMNGELGASHAYEMGGDHPTGPRAPVGRLGADLEPTADGWIIRRIVRGDPGDAARRSPLAAPGLQLREGDVILAVDGERVGPERHPASVLAPDRQVEVLVRSGEGTRTVVVKPTGSDRDLRYRAWVLANRRRVREATGGRAGYVHVPDMGPAGYAEFHRDWAVESRREGVVVDVRWNRGGHVSQLLLQTITQRRLGGTETRWVGQGTWPTSSPAGPMVALTNEMAGSDGDIFSYAWQRLGLGPLIGTRTWGGTVGIWPRHMLVDRTITTQPEFANAFEGVGTGLENRGVDPDVVVDEPPGPGDVDDQLEAGISSLLALLDAAGARAR